MLCALIAPITATLFATGGFDGGQNTRQGIYELESQRVSLGRVVAARDSVAQGTVLLQSYTRALHN
jgi:hypothetical protein